MKKNLLLLLLLFITSCGSTGNKPRDFEVEYKVINASNRTEPMWITDINKFKGEKGIRYFVSESEHAVKRLCVKSATARANATIASEVKQHIESEYSEVTREDEDRNIEKFYSESLNQIVNTKVSGIRVVNQYWEKRKFESDKDGGSKLQYSCFTLVSITEKRLEKAIKLASNKYKKVIKESLKN